MRIIFICNEYPPRPHAGIGTAVQTIARGLSKRGHQVTVVGLGDANEETRDQGIRVVTLQMNTLRYVGNLLSRLRLRRWLSAAAKAGLVDLIEVPDSAGLLPFGINDCAVVVRLHNSFTVVNKLTGEGAGRGISFYERCTVTRNRNWIAVSNAVMTLTRRIFEVSPERGAVVHNSVDSVPSILPELPDLPGRFVFFAGNVRRIKGADALAEAMRDIMTERPDLHLVYAGGIFKENGRLISETISEILGPKMKDRVHFLGRLDREKIWACMRRAKVFVLPSHIEACPLVVLEAMSCGVPVVFTKYPPGPELVVDGETGLLADPFSPKDLSEKISSILDDPALANRLSRNAQTAVAERFCPGKCLDATELFYEECLRA